MKYDYTPTGMSKIKKTDPLKCQQGCGEIANLTLLVEMKNRTTALGESVL